MKERKRPLTIAQTVAMELKEQILTRQIKAGEPLRQESIAKSFGTSIIPVREALRHLAAEGLVELSAHRGAVATELTLDKALEWIHLRRLIEVDLIGIAVDKMTDAQISDAEKTLERYDLALSEHTDLEHWSEFNWEFHAALYAPADRPETMQVLAMLHNKCDRYVRLQLLSGDHIQRAQAEHAELIELCKARRKRAIKSLMDQHISEVEEDLINELRN